MSVRVMSAVFDRYPAGGGERLLALALADVARDDGVLMINDSVGELARKTLQTHRGVQKQLRRMVQIGWLELVRSSDGGRNRVAMYRISKGWIDGGLLQPDEVLQQGQEAPTDEPQNPERRDTKPRTEFTPEHSSPLNGATRNPERGSGAIEPLGPNTNTPPNPPRGAPPLNGGDAEPPVSKPLTLQAWLERCAERGEVPIPPGDPIFGYCEQVGIGEAVLALHWREFKARRSAGRKRQLDWRATFRNSVRDNWYRLWYLKPGAEAQLTTQGLQAEAVMRAEQAAA